MPGKSAKNMALARKSNNIYKIPHGKFALDSVV
jgi:hypothetical protein